jgi:acyl-CoA reductase-like NAD-dependent aldehyde dehydrogenase
MNKVISRNPATGEVIQELDATRMEDLPIIFSQARAAQIQWELQPVQKRAEFLYQLRETLLNHTDDLVHLIAQENGKPHFEALVNEILPAIDTVTYFAKRSPKLLKNRAIRLTLMKHRKSYLNYWPVGVVAIISPWNYPFLLPFCEIISALVAGNAVIFKPSEVTPLVGLKIQDLCNEAGLPTYLLQTLLGDAALGAAIIQQKPGKIFFTGSVSTGKKVMTAAAEHLIPVNLELGGKDAMIILPDADLDYASSAALWGGFSNSGQVCASTERILIHERIAEQFLSLLKVKLAKLRQGPSLSSSNDLGPITYEKQKDTYAKQIDEAKAEGATFISGGDFSGDRRFLQPTIVTGPTVEKLSIYNEETFGPVVAVTTYKSVAEAIKKAIDSKYGLLASVITKDIKMGEEVAKQLAVGTVTINEVVYTAGLGETPWGGLKESGFGRSHSDTGLYEFVNIRHIHKPRLQLFSFKSLWWFPYTPFQYQTFRLFAGIYRRNWIDKIKAIPDLLWNLAKMIKDEKRL